MNPKRPAEIEGWTLQVLDAVAAGKTVEDSRVDLKRTLPEPKKAARRIAGHANAAGGDSILWVVGVDEGVGLVGHDGDALDRADWLAKVSAEFDGGIVPSVRDVIVPRGDRRFLALCFETDRAPYVVKNPNGGGIDREVPWREGTAVRTARREDLLRMLRPRVALPHVEFLGGNLDVRIKKILLDKPEDEYGFAVQIVLHLTPEDGRRLVIPQHRCYAEMKAGGTSLGRATYCRLSLPAAKSHADDVFKRHLRNDPAVHVSAGQKAQEENSYQCSFAEPAVLEAHAGWDVPFQRGTFSGDEISLNLAVGFAGSGDLSLPISIVFRKGEAREYFVHSYVLP